MKHLFFKVFFIFLSIVMSSGLVFSSEIEWESSTGEVTGYRVYYGTLEGDYPNQIDVGSSLSSSLDQLSLKEGETYYFVVRAYNTAGESSDSNFISYTTPYAVETYWPFDEGSGTVAKDNFSSGNDLSLNEASWTTGYQGTALSLNGSSGYAFIPDASLAGSFPAKSSDPAEDFTLSAWIYMDKVNTRQPIICKQENGTRGFVFLVEDSNKLSIQVFNKADERTSVFSSASLKAGQWYHVAASYDFIDDGTSSIKLYINGINDGSTSTAVGPINTNTQALELGRYYWSSSYNWYMDGVIDEVRIFDKALSAADVESLMDGGSIQEQSDTTAPVVTITSPTSGTSYGAETSSLNISGTASDAEGVTGVTWSSSTGVSGTASGTENWGVTGINLSEGENVITVTARDEAGNSSTDVLTVTYTIPELSQTIITVKPNQASKLPSIIENAESGVTIELEDGTYIVHSRLLFAKKNVTLRSASGDRNSVVIDGEYQGYLIQISSQNVTIADLTLKRAYYHLIHVIGGGENVFLHNLKLIDSRQQFVKVNPSDGLYPDNGVMSGSYFELTDQGMSNVDSDYGGCYTGGFDALSVRDWSVRDNYFKNIYCTNGGLPTPMILFWKSSRDPIVERNIISNCARGIGFGIGETGNYRAYSDNPTASISGEVGHIGGIIRNNFIFGDIGSYFDTGIGLEQALNVEVYHNTIFSSNDTFSSIDSRFENTNPIITNNLVEPGMTVRQGADPSYISNFEGAYSDLFVDTSSGNLHIVPSASEIINKGASLGTKVTTDIDGEVRSSPPDIGADEYTFE